MYGAHGTNASKLIAVLWYQFGYFEKHCTNGKYVSRRNMYLFKCKVDGTVNRLFVRASEDKVVEYEDDGG